ncbi:MAG: 2OG-Fe(II) oxygenase family protein [Pseudomonadota bacterium]
MRTASIDVEIPVIDFSRFNPDDHAGLEVLVTEVDQALSGVGSMAVRHIGIDDVLLRQVFNASRTFFSSDESQKRGSAYRSASENFGYQGIGQENLDPSAPADLEETFTLRLLHYPSIDDAPETGQLGAGAHTDFGLLTLLFQNEIGGLEVQTDDGEWQCVGASTTDVVINSGDLPEVWNNGRYRSTPHRVQPISKSTDRQSIAMFVDPDSATKVAVLPSCVSPNNPARFRPTSAGAHLQERIQAAHKSRFEV